MIGLFENWRAVARPVGLSFPDLLFLVTGSSGLQDSRRDGFKRKLKKDD